MPVYSPTPSDFYRRSATYLDPTQDWTWRAWVYLHGSPSQRVITLFDASGAYSTPWLVAFIAGASSDQPTFQVDPGSGEVDAAYGSAVTFGGWHTFALRYTRSTTTLALFVDEVLSTSATVNMGSATPFTDETLATDGSFSSSELGFAQLRVWQAALTTTELSTERRSRNAVRVANLLSDTPLTNTSALTDDSGNGHAWTASGSPTYTPGPNTAITGAQDINLSAFTAYTTTQEAWDGAQTVQDLWFAYLPVAGDDVLEIYGDGGSIANYRVTTTVWYGPAASPTQIGSSADNRPMQQDIVTGVTPGERIYVRCRKAVGNNHNPSTLSFRLARGAGQSALTGDLFINDSSPGYPGVVMDPATAIPKGYILNFAAGEGVQIFTDGIIAALDAFTVHGVVLYDTDFTVRATPSMPSTHYTTALGTNQTSAFWALNRSEFAHSFAVSIDRDGVVSTPLDLGIDSVSQITAQASNAAVYVMRGTELYKVTNPGGVATLFLTVDAGFAFSTNTFMMTDDTLLVSYEKAATTPYIKRFNLSGVQQGATITLTGVDPFGLEHIFADDEDPSYFWIWWQTSTLNKFWKIRVSDGTPVVQLSRMKFIEGISQEGATVGSVIYSGADFSCVPILLRANASSSGGGGGGGGDNPVSGRRGIYVPTRGVAGTEGGGYNARFTDLGGAIQSGPSSGTSAGRIIPVVRGRRAIYVPTIGIGGAEGDGRDSDGATVGIRRVVVYDGEGYTHR